VDLITDALFQHQHQMSGEDTAKLRSSYRQSRNVSFSDSLETNRANNDPMLARKTHYNNDKSVYSNESSSMDEHTMQRLISAFMSSFGRVENDIGTEEDADLLIEVAKLFPSHRQPFIAPTPPDAKKEWDAHTGLQKRHQQTYTPDKRHQKINSLTSRLMTFLSSKDKDHSESSKLLRSSHHRRSHSGYNPEEHDHRKDTINDKGVFSDIVKAHTKVRTEKSLSNALEVFRGQNEPEMSKSLKFVTANSSYLLGEESNVDKQLALDSYRKKPQSAVKVIGKSRITSHSVGIQDKKYHITMQSLPSKVCLCLDTCLSVLYS
jgi:hypothetical protein